MNLTKIQNKLGFKLKDFQQDAIERIDAGNDLIVSAPTGAGKTAIYLGASMLDKGVTVIVYPLVSLIRDQERRFKERGFESASFYGQVTGKKKQNNLDAVADGVAGIVLTTPESLNKNDKLHRAIKEAGGCGLIAVDEAHVFEDWSNSFRPGYRQLGKTARAINAQRITMCSATITPESALDGANIFGRWDFDVISLPAIRENLHYVGVKLTEAGRQLAAFVERPEYESPGIIYTMTVYRLNQIADRMDEYLDESILRYNGQMSTGARNKNQREWTESNDEWIIATKAFGMGIDKPNVRTIIHAELPASLVDYAQETGRAGRDGEDSYCWLNATDGGSSAEFLTMGNYPSIAQIKSVFHYISDSCPDDRFHSVSAGQIARGLGWNDRQGVATVRTCRGWLSGSGLLAGRKASADYTIDVYSGAGERVSKQEKKMIQALRRAGKVDDFGDGSFRVVATRDHLAAVCEPIYSTWQNKLRQFDKTGVILYQAPEKSSEVRVLNREFSFDAERLIRTKTRAKERLDAMRSFVGLADEDKPGAIEKAIGLEAARIKEDLAREKANREPEEAPVKRTPRRTRQRKNGKVQKNNAEILSLLDDGPSEWVEEMEHVGRDESALFCTYPHSDGNDYGFYIVFGDIGRMKAKEKFPGYPVYTFVEANHLGKMDDPLDRELIHKLMVQLDGEYLDVLENFDNQTQEN